MKIYKTDTYNLFSKQYADKNILIYEFCYDILELVLEEEYFDYDLDEEQYENYFYKIESHLIASHINLFNTDCYELLEWVHPGDIMELEYVIDRTLPTDIKPLIVSIQLKPDKLKSQELTIEEKKKQYFFANP